MYRQGDILLAPVGQVPFGRAIERDSQHRIVLAYGEATGHAHAIYDAGAKLYAGMEPDFGRYLEVTETVNLRHEEHAAITVPPGLYRVVQQREYQLDNLTRYVED